MRKSIFIIMLLSSFLEAADTAESNSNSKNGLFIRGGVGLTSGSSKIRREETDIATDVVTKTLYTTAVIGNAVDLSIGYENYDRKVRFYFNTKVPYDNIDSYETKSTRNTGGIEGFSGVGSINVNYGVMLGGGKTTFKKVGDDSPVSEMVGFLVAEPYVGIDGLLKGGFGYYLKLGYEIKGYDSLILDNTITNTSTRDDLVVYTVNVGVGLAYKF